MQYKNRGKSSMGIYQKKKAPDFYSQEEKKHIIVEN